MHYNMRVLVRALKSVFPALFPRFVSYLFGPFVMKHPCVLLCTFRLMSSFRYIAAATRICYPPRRCIYDGLLMAFITQLDPSCKGFIYNALTECAIEPPTGEENNPTTPPHLAASEACFVEGFWIKYGPQPPLDDPKFILTASIIINLKNIVRAISVERFPVLLQGPTSAGDNIFS